MKLSLPLVVLVALAAFISPIAAAATGDVDHVSVKQPDDDHAWIPTPAHCKSVAIDGKGCAGTKELTKADVHIGFFANKGKNACADYGAACEKVLKTPLDTVVWGCAKQANRWAVRAFCTVYTNHAPGDGAIISYTGWAGRLANIPQLVLQSNGCKAVINDYCSADWEPITKIG